MPTQDYDAIVVGTGAASGSATSRFADAGWSVAVIDKHPPGGTCALRGCTPKKVMVTAAHQLDSSNRMRGKGPEADNARIDWPNLIRFVRSFTEPYPGKARSDYEKAGIDVFNGTARFLSDHEIEVSGERLRFRKCVLAAGAKPAPLPIPGFEHVTPSDEFLALPHLPRRIAFLGGGYISLEFSHIARIAGAEVCILEKMDGLLSRFDDDLVDALCCRTRDLGIGIRTGTKVTRIEKQSDFLRVHCENSEPIDADLVVHGGGRAPDIDELDLAAAGIERQKRGIAVNEFLQTTNPDVYAAGDCAATEGLPLTPVAGLEGKTAALNILEGNRHLPDYRGTASAVYAIPPIATVGLTESEVRERGFDYLSKQSDYATFFTSKHIGATCGYAKILIDKEDDRILGAHLFGYGVDEIINIFALAIRHGITARQIKETLFAYPTHGHDARYFL